MKKFKRNELLLIFGKWTTCIGNIIFDYANSVSIVRLFTNSPHILAIYQSSETFIQILFNLIGGVAADSRNKKKIVVMTDLIAAAICFLLSFSIKTEFVAETIIIANILLAITYAFNSPTYKSIVREVIEKDRIGFFNSIMNGGTEVIQIIGPLISFISVSHIGVQGAMLFNSATFILSAIAEMKLTRLCPSMDEKNTKRNVFNEIKDGIIYLLHERHIFYLVLLSALVNFFLAGYNLIIPFTDIIIVQGFYSKALMMQAVGGIIGSFISSKLAVEITEKITTPIVFLGLTGGFLLLEPFMAITQNIYLCLFPFIGFGVALTIFNIQFMSYIQIWVEEAYLGRVFSVVFTIAVSFMPIGSFVFSSFGKTNDLSCFAFVGGGIVLLAVVFLILLLILPKGT